MSELTKYFHPKQDIRPLLFFLSFLLSALWLGRREPINIDGILYLQAAQGFLDSGLKGAWTVYHWPFYSILIAWTSMITQFSILHAAYLLNTFLITLVIINFVTLIKILGGDIKVQIVAGFVILFLPELTHAREMIVRDFGYYAFALFSLIYLLRYQQTQQFRHALLWGICITLATLFRREGLVLQIFVPWILLLRTHTSFSKRLIHFAKAYVINLILLAGLALVGFASHKLTLNLIFSLYGFAIHGYQIFWNSFVGHISILEKFFFNIFSANKTYIFLLGGLITLFITAFISSLNPIYTLLAFYGYKKRLLRLSNNEWHIILAFIVINVVMLFAFLNQYLFLTGRYMLLLIIIVSIVIPFSIIDLWQSVRTRLNNKNTWYASLLLLLLVIPVVKSTVPIGPSKRFFITAGDWIQNNTPKESRFFMNEPRLVFYSRRPGTTYSEEFFPFGESFTDINRLKKFSLSSYDYLALEINHQQIDQAKIIFQELGRVSIKDFVNNRGDRIFILKKTNP